MENLNTEKDVKTTKSEPNPNTETNGGNEDLLNQLESIIDKRFEKMRSSIVKDNTESSEEAESVLKQLRERMNSKKNESETKYNTLKTDYDTLKAEYDALQKEIFDGKMTSAASEVATELGIETSSLKHVMKLVNSESFVEEGEIKKDNIKKAFEELLTELPALKKSVKEEKNNKKTDEDAGTGFKNVGVTEPQTKTETTINSVLNQKKWNRVNH